MTCNGVESVDLQIRSVSVVGLGKLGASMAAALASRGLEVVGADIDRRVVDRLNQGRAPVTETGLERLVAENRSRLRATLSVEEAVEGSDLSFIVVPTPSDESGGFSLECAAPAAAAVGRGLAAKSAPHTVVMASTVLPGACRNGLLPILESESKKRAGRDFGFCYGPQFIALGSVISDFLSPDLALIGELDEDSGARLAALYGRVLAESAEIKRLSLENAELAKLAVNTFVTTKISFANMLAELCEFLPGGDVDTVTDAIGADHRIGHAFLKGAIGYGGPCFPRDNLALARLTRVLGSRARIAEAVDGYNRSIVDRLVERIVGLVTPAQTVAVLGLAYKPSCNVVEESQGVELARKLAAAGLRVLAYDPLAGSAARAALADVVVLDSLDGCLEQAHALVIATPDPEFARIRSQDLRSDIERLVVFDCWRLLADSLGGVDRIEYAAVGLGSDEPPGAERLGRLSDRHRPVVS